VADRQRLFVTGGPPKKSAPVRLLLASKGRRWCVLIRQFGLREWHISFASTAGLLGRPSSQVVSEIYWRSIAPHGPAHRDTLELVESSIPK
jgi:hypothetical protein